MGTYIKSAVVSPCGTYRYELRREWDATLPVLCYIMLNPSTADAHVDDATIKKCVRIARLRGYGAIRVVNLYAFRTVSPAVLRQAYVVNGLEYIVGPDNAAHVTGVINDCHTVVAAWGVYLPESGWPWLVEKLLASCKAKCLGTNKNGSPRHPLYLRDDSALVNYMGGVPWA